MTRNVNCLLVPVSRPNSLYHDVMTDRQIKATIYDKQIGCTIFNLVICVHKL